MSAVKRKAQHVKRRTPLIYRLVCDHLSLFCRKEEPPTHFPILNVLSSKASSVTKFEMSEGVPRRHVATAKLTSGPLVAWLSVLASFDVRSVVWWNQICGAGAILINSGLQLSISQCSLFVAYSRNKIVVSGPDKSRRTGTRVFVH